MINDLFNLLRDICAEGSLQFTVAKIPMETDCANNLLNMEIHETDEGGKLYMDYNAYAYSEITHKKKGL